ncbi:hypothetical protein LguiA_008399 [Lonicera macranthoides]
MQQQQEWVFTFCSSYFFSSFKLKLLHHNTQHPPPPYFFTLSRNSNHRHSAAASYYNSGGTNTYSLIICSVLFLFSSLAIYRIGNGYLELLCFQLNFFRLGMIRGRKLIYLAQTK